MKRFTKMDPTKARPAPMFRIEGMSAVETRLFDNICHNNWIDSEDYKVLSSGGSAGAWLVTAKSFPEHGLGILEFWSELDKAEKAVEYIESQLEDPKRLALMQSLIDAGI